MSTVAKVDRRKNNPNMGAPSKWDPALAFRVFELAQTIYDEKALAKALGVDVQTHRKWLRTQPTYLLGFNEGRAAANRHNAIGAPLDYVYRTLNPDERDVWESLMGYMRPVAGETVDEARARVDKSIEAVSKIPDGIRKRLFIHSYVMSGFKMNEACRSLGIGYGTYRAWLQDEAFATLIQAIEWHMDNFIEGAFYDLVGMRSEKAVLHGVQSRLRHRGYGREIAVTGEIKHKHAVEVDVDNLPQDVRRNLLVALSGELPGAAPPPALTVDAVSFAVADAMDEAEAENSNETPATTETIDSGAAGVAAPEGYARW